MLTLSIAPLLHSKGIKHLTPYLQQKGFSYHTARYLVGNKLARFNLDTIEKLCIALECTPNDILYFSTSSDAVPTNHPLRALNMERYHNEIAEGVQQLNTAEVAELKAALRNIIERKNKDE
jgi:DNA-binding Xre family transcriptional regulator